MAARTSARFAILFVVLAVVIALITWLAVGVGKKGDAGPTPGADAIAGAVSLHVDGAPVADTQLSEVKTPQGDASGARANAPVQRARVTDTGPTDAELSEAWWVHGRVTYPEGTPADERAFVLAQGREFGAKKLHRLPVNPDGTFRVAFHKSTKKGSLRLDARYVYLAEIQSVKPADADKDIVLAPVLGGGLQGRIVPSAAAQPFVSDLVGTTITATGWKSGMNGPRVVTATANETLEFELGGLDPDIQWGLTCQPKGFAAAFHERAAVVSGKRSPFELKLQRGARITGTVRDAAGAPVEGVQVRCDGRSWDALGMPTNIASDKEGAFTIEGARPGKIHLSFHKQNYLTAKLDEIVLADGETRSGIAGVLTRGNSVSGVVRWADGKPAGGVRVEVQEPIDPSNEDYYVGPSELPSAKTADDGTFMVTGLGTDVCTVTARSAPKAVAAVEAGAAKEKRSPKVRHQAQLEGVAPNSTALVLVLAAGNTLRGHVVDDRGAGVEAFTVKADPVEEPGERWNARGNTISRDFTDKGGTFELFGLTDGEWNVHVETKSGSKSDTANIVFPREDQVLEVVIARSATLRGLVLDPAGAAVSGARIEVAVTGAERSWSNRPPDKSRITGDDGTFETAVPSGAIEVHAERAGSAGSLIAKLTVAPTQAAGPITLQLQNGGTITGEVRDKNGKLEGGRSLSVWGHENSESQQATTDATGRFRMEHVQPGKVSLSLQPSRAEMEESRTANGSYSYRWGETYNSQVELVIVDGVTTEVALGGAPANPVRVFGVVRAAKPLQGVQVGWYRKNGDKTGREWKQAVTDADGRYETTVYGAGEYQVSFNSTKGGNASMQCTVPAGSSFELNATLPSGRISGRVVTEAGKPLAGLQVSAQSPNHKEADGNELRTGYGSVVTLGDGSFSIEMLSAGEYTLTAEPQRWQPTAKTKSSGTAAQSGIVLEAGGNVTGIVLRMPRAGSVHGVVTSGNGPVAGAKVVTRGNGPGSFGESDTTDASGRFQIDGLNPGKVVLLAYSDAGASARSEGVEIRSDESAEVNLRLDPAGKIHIVIQDAQGKSTHTPWNVVDDQGRECSLYPMEWSDADTGDTGWTVGPLPVGAYTVKVGPLKGGEEMDTSGGENSGSENNNAGKKEAGKRIERQVQVRSGMTEKVVVKLP